MITRPAPTAGVALLLVAWTLLALDPGGSFTLHMAAHVTVVALAAPLLALGLSRPPPAWATPLPVSFLEFLVVWLWHAPALRALAAAVPLAAALEQASFLAAGVLLWWSCLTPGRAAAGGIGLLVTSMHTTLLGALFALAPRPLYGVGAVTCLGLPLDALADQQLGGAVMLMVGAAAYLAGGLMLIGRVLAGEAPP
jgi:putative membrane protein